MIFFCLVLWLLSITPELTGYEGFYYRDAAGVGHYGLEGLSMDILEKIRQATGYPLNTNVYSRFVPAQTKGYESVVKPKLAKKGWIKDNFGSSVKFLGGGRSTLGRNNKYSESKSSGKKGKENWGEVYGESSGEKDGFMSEAEFTDDHYHKEEGKKGHEFKGGHKRNKSYLSKGFQDVYHKDETKKADSFWDNEEKHGKWLKYGAKKHKHKKGEKKKVGDEKKTEAKEGKEYKSSKVHGSEQSNKMSAKKEKKNMVDSEYSKKETEMSRSQH